MPDILEKKGEESEEVGEIRGRNAYMGGGRMSEYKVGDKVVIEVTAVSRFGESYELAKTSQWSAGRIERVAEPLSNYTEPLEARIRRQAERITRLLAENKGLKEQVKVLSKQPDPKANAEREAGQSEAWDLARKIALMDDEGGYTDEELTGMFGTGNDYYVFKENPTYAEAAAKVAEWKKKPEICVGDVVVPKSTKTPEILVLCTVNGMTGICITKGDQYGKMFERREFEGYEKTGRHIDVSAMLAQIGGGNNETEN